MYTIFRLICCIVFIFSICPNNLIAQVADRAAVLPLTQDATIPIMSAFKGKKNDALPMSISLRPYCPTPEAQGRTVACAAWATGFGALTISHAVLENITNKTDIQHKSYSAAFIYNMTSIPLSSEGTLTEKASGQAPNEPCEKPLSLPEALRFLQKNGTCYAQTFPNQSPCDKPPSASAQAEAATFKIQDFEALFAETADSALKIKQIRTVLADYQPIVVGMQITASFQNLPKGEGYWGSKQGNETIVGGHALVLIGYDHAEQTFELMNSWGTDWGDNGFVHIGYSDFLKCLKQAYRLILPKHRIKPLAEGSFTIKNALADILPVKSTARLLNNPLINCYEIKGFDPSQMLFQIEATLNTNAFVYFLMPNNQPLKKWVLAGQTLLLPGYDEALDIKTDLCLLISTKPIADLEADIRGISKQKGSFLEQIHALFKAVFIEKIHIIFEKDRIAFKIKSPSTTGVVPIFIQIR